MKICFSPYELCGQGTFLNRKGALLRVSFEDGRIGYADCHPWPELGDWPLKTQLDLLRCGRRTNLLQRSLQFASIDADARAEKRNLFTGLPLPVSHWLIHEESYPDDFQFFKIKSVELAKRMAPRLRNDQRIRLDLNHRLSYLEFTDFLDGFRDFLPYFDFFEDPFPFDRKLWDKIENEYGIALALDRAPPEEAFSIRIIKPAVDDPNLVDRCKRRIFTSYLDHPLGQLGAAYEAARHGTNEACGLLSHVVYKPNSFSERLHIDRGVLIPPADGYGFGFDDLLHEQVWTAL
jgi:o-succinylbenzoate synthase